MSVSRRQILIAGAAIAALPLAARPSEGAVRRAKAAPFVLDDASRLNETPISRQALLTSGDDDRLFRELRATLGEAASASRPIAIGGARHSMGGQSLPRHGIAASFATSTIEPDTAQRCYRVTAGTRWRDVIRVLDPLGFSPAVTQSNHDFSIGGTLSVNAHGWPVPFGPFGATVRKFRLMLADGAVVSCSPTENAELFRLAIGGYGLFGIVVDAELAMTENVLLTPRSEQAAADALAPRFIALAIEPAVRMLYGRLSVARENFLRDALLVNYVPASRQPGKLPPPKKSATYSLVSRSVFRAQTGSERGKQARWLAETKLMPQLGRAAVTRNTLLDTPVAALADSNLKRTDILHEYSCRRSVSAIFWPPAATSCRCTARTYSMSPCAMSIPTRRAC